MAAANSEFVGGSMDFRLHYLRFADEGFVAHSMLYSISHLVPPGGCHHTRYEGEECHNGRKLVINLSGELRLHIRS